MSSLPRELYPNVDFDLSLGGKNPLATDPGGMSHVHALGAHFLIAAGDGETVRLHQGVQPSFCAYLDNLEVPHGRAVPYASPSRRHLFTPFGWNRHAAELNRRYDHPSAHPPVDCVSRVNGRAFGLGVEEAFAVSGDGGPSSRSGGGRAFSSPAAIREFLAGQESRDWVAKTEHGNAGLGNRRFIAPPLVEQDLKALEARLRSSPPLLIEPWHQRERDFGVAFAVEADGKASRIVMHELRNTPSGAFAGIRIGAGASAKGEAFLSREWQDLLLKACRFTAARLGAEGYFGPANIDAYAFGEGERIFLRPLVEINARHSMSLPAHALAALFPDRHLRWDLIPARRLASMEHYRDFAERLGEFAYAPAAREGVLAVSPLPGPKPAQRFSVACLASTPESLEIMHARLGAACLRERGDACT